VADGIPAPAASRRTTRVLFIAAGALVVALAVLVTLPGRGTPNVVARATPNVGSSAGPGTQTTSTVGPTGGPTASPTWSPSATAGTTTTLTTSPPADATAGPTSGPGLPGQPTVYRPHTSRAATPPARATRSTSSPGAAPTTNSTAQTSPLPGFAFGDRVTLLDPAVVDSRVVAVSNKAVMRTVSTSASLEQRQASSWLVRHGLAGDGCVSLESVAMPGRYLVSSGKSLAVAGGTGSSFTGAATFCVHSPALDGSWGVSLSPWSAGSTSLTRRRDGYLELKPSGDSPLLQTFKLWTAPA